uniref:Uncharacterized protein n=1 Tax=Glossina palpalis gambiensis TaxID=67801 RepID=A0A1B0C5I5_9MUSC
MIVKCSNFRRIQLMHVDTYCRCSREFGLRQLDISLLSQLWALNDSIQEFRTLIQDQEQEEEDIYSAHSRDVVREDSCANAKVNVGNNNAATITISANNCLTNVPQQMARNLALHASSYP